MRSVGWQAMVRRAGWAALAGCLAVGFPAAAEDVIVTQARTYRGKVKSADAAGIAIEVAAPGGSSVMTVPRNLIVSATVAAPEGVVRGLAAYEKGDFKAAQASLEPTLQQYQGLDVAWASRSLIYYARACLAAGDYDKAQKAFAQFVAGYPRHPWFADAQAGLVETEVAKKNYEPALAKFRELAAIYDKQLKPNRAETAAAAAVYIGIGKCLEGLAKPDEALQAYLTVIALYPDERRYPEALFRSAVLYAGLNHPEQAADRFKELISDYQASDWAARAAEEQKKLAARPAAEAAPAATKEAVPAATKAAGAADAKPSAP